MATVWHSGNSQFFHRSQACGFLGSKVVETSLVTAQINGLRPCPVCRDLAWEQQDYERLPATCESRLSLLAAKVKGRKVPPAQHPRRVYVIELAASAVPDSRHGLPPLYVGESYLAAPVRLEQHLSGYKASKWVKKYGRRVRPDIYDRFPAVGSVDEARKLEADVAAILRDCGFTVFGGH